ncbi:MAG: SH3 domain-containing protein [Alphaproteobacteria bacterium]|nr:SH3 domain-containing protein [Alphaproteobacteria bacterium]
MKRILAAAAVALATLLPAAPPAAAQSQGWVIGTVNLRAGPGTAYPRITAIPAGAPVAVFGCLEGWSWCDVAFGEARGWVAGNYISYEYLGRRAPVVEIGPQIALPIIAFTLGSYWDNHYRGRPFYRERPRWESYYHRAPPPRYAVPRRDFRPEPHYRPAPAYRPDYHRDRRPDYRPEVHRDRRPDYRPDHRVDRRPDYRPDRPDRRGAVAPNYNPGFHQNRTGPGGTGLRGNQGPGE